MHNYGSHEAWHIPCSLCLHTHLLHLCIGTDAMQKEKQYLSRFAHSTIQIKQISRNKSLKSCTHTHRTAKHKYKKRLLLLRSICVRMARLLCKRCTTKWRFCWGILSGNFNVFSGCIIIILFLHWMQRQSLEQTNQLKVLAICSNFIVSPSLPDM